MPANPPSNIGDRAAWQALLETARNPGSVRVSPLLRGKSVLVTGAGGSIGSALAQSIAASSPAALLLLDSSEPALQTIDRSLRDAGCNTHIPIAGSVCDAGLLTEIFEGHRPQIIFHAAALKHVPLMELNPRAAIATNALGTFTVAELSTRFRAEHLVQVSTDKAVDPVSIMGACKRIAELALLALGNRSTRMTAVRLGNVLGSQGSVLPLFQEQIARGGPVTVTHRDVVRYVIPVERAVESLLCALESQADASVLAPELGRPLKILDLARELLEAHNSDARIEFTGLRPGDKMSESMLSTRERWSAEPSPAGLRAIASPAIAANEFRDSMEELNASLLAHDNAGALRAVLALVPEYQPSDAVKGLLSESQFAEAVRA